jgi:hypothetical protein
MISQSQEIFRQAENYNTFGCPTDRLRPADEKQKALSVGLNLSVGEKFFRVLFRV